MALRVVELGSVELDQELDRVGFWHRGSELGPKLGAARIGAAVYEAREGVPIWPYHYHYPQEEWLYVLSGNPVLRDGQGRRRLAAADLVCFPRGHRGAHTVEGPGRFVIFDGQESPGPWSSVYVDSDKLSLAGTEEGRLNAMIAPRESGVTYWSGEGGEPVTAQSVRREPAQGQRMPAVTLDAVTGSDGEAGHAPLALAAHLGSEQLAGFLLELACGEAFGPYRYEFGREVWMLVLSGELTVRHPDGETTVAAGQITCFAEGPAGGRLPRNDGDEPARALLISTTGFPSTVCYPETGEWLLRPHPGEPEIRLSERPPS